MQNLPIKQAFLIFPYAHVRLHIRGVRNFIRLHYVSIVLILNALNNFSYALCNCSIKKLLYNNTRSLLLEIILYGRMFHSFLLNNFHELLRNNNNSNNKNNNNFVFQILALGYDFEKIMNL